MKIQRSKEQGSALLVTLIITAVLGTALASYMQLVQYQNRSVVRSQYWNGAIPMSEAGVEEALAHLNKIGNGSRATNGWILKDGKYYMKRTLSGGHYEVWIDNASQPIVKSTGYVLEPSSQTEISRTVQTTTTKSTSLMRGIIAKKGISMSGGGTTINSFDSQDPNWSTNGRYDPAKAHDLGYAGAVTGNIDTGTGGVWGYVGTGPNGTFSGNVGDAVWMATKSGMQPGHYADDLNVSFPDVAPPFSGGALSPAVNQIVTTMNTNYLISQVTSPTLPSPVPVGGVTTNVQVITSLTKPAFIVPAPYPTTNTAATSTTNFPVAGTYVGNVVTRLVTQGNGKNKKTVTYYDYAKITGYNYPTTSYTYNTTTTNTTTTTTTYDFVTDGGNYQMNSFSMSGTSKFLVKGNTTLYLPNGLSQAGQAQIIILPGGSLKLYVGGSLDLKGNGVLNLSQDATHFQIMGLPSCTSIDLGGNAAFTGTIYAPNADLKMGGGGSNTYDTVGAIVVKSATLNGHFNFHYDEMLGRVTGPIQYKVASWNEI
jgi:hypothetical protein